VVCRPEEERRGLRRSEVVGDGGEPASFGDHNRASASMVTQGLRRLGNDDVAAAAGLQVPSSPPEKRRCYALTIFHLETPERGIRSADYFVAGNSGSFRPG